MSEEPRKTVVGELATVDTVFDTFMRPVFVNEPDVVRRRLIHSTPERWVKVCIGSSQEIVSIPEYLYKEKYESVLETISELVDKKELPLYRRQPERYQALIERTARQLIERIMDK